MLFTFAGMSAATTYTAANVKGSYSVLVNGYGGTTLESAYVGLFTFDGVNTVTGYLEGLNDGSPEVDTITSGSTYTVSANGQGTLTANATSSLNGPINFQIDFVLNSVTASVARSLQMVLLSNADPQVWAWTATSINLSAPATAAKLKGTYSVLLTWWTSGTTGRGYLGTLVFDGKSKVTTTLVIRTGGSGSATVKGTGTYSVNADGSGSMTLALLNGTTADFDFVMNSAPGTAVAKGIQLIEVDNPSSTTVNNGNAVFE
jgi:VCBS repeat-containing protein